MTNVHPKASARRSSTSPVTSTPRGVGPTVTAIALSALLGTVGFAWHAAIAPANAANATSGTSGAEANPPLVSPEWADAPAPIPFDAESAAVDVGADRVALAARPRRSAERADLDLVREPRHAVPASPGARTEAQHLVELRALAARDPAELDARVDAVWAGRGPACEQFAALRVVYESSRPGTAARLAMAVSNLARESSERSAAVADPFVHWLGLRAGREALARDVLEAVTWSRGVASETLVRVHAVRELVRAAPDSDLARLEVRVNAEPDPLVHSAGRAALDERTRPSARQDKIEETP